MNSLTGVVLAASIDQRSQKDACSFDVYTHLHLAQRLDWISRWSRYLCVPDWVVMFMLSVPTVAKWPADRCGSAMFLAEYLFKAVGVLKIHATPYIFGD